MPENRNPSFIQVKKWVLEAAHEQRIRMSVRDAKRLAGDYLTKDLGHDYYKRTTYSDPVGEGVARRWYQFAHAA